MTYDDIPDIPDITDITGRRDDVMRVYYAMVLSGEDGNSVVDGPYEQIENARAMARSLHNEYGRVTYVVKALEMTSLEFVVIKEG